MILAIRTQSCQMYPPQAHTWSKPCAYISQHQLSNGNHFLHRVNFPVNTLREPHWKPVINDTRTVTIRYDSCAHDRQDYGHAHRAHCLIATHPALLYPFRDLECQLYHRYCDTGDAWTSAEIDRVMHSLRRLHQATKKEYRDMSTGYNASQQSHDEWLIRGTHLVRVHRTPRKALSTPFGLRDSPTPLE